MYLLAGIHNLFRVMNNEHTVIHDIDFQIIGEFFKGLERQGPGSEETTKLALQLAGAYDKEVHMADIGCGTGGQTFLLAKYTKGTIKACDVMPSFVASFQEKIKQTAYEDRISVTEDSMFSLPYAKEEFDLIWAEGSIYHLGFEKGLKEFRQFLKPGGMIGVSEASWFTRERPEEISTFWNENYPEIDMIGNKVQQMEEAGYKVVAHFILPEECWWNYFNPQVAYFDEFLQAHPGSKPAEDLIEQIKGEMALYEKYKDYYGYVFYIGQKM